MKSRLVTDRRLWNGRLYLQMTAKCGRANCPSCPHGPYWYVRIRHRAGRLVTKYCGKVAPWDRAAEARARFLAECEAAATFAEASAEDAARREFDAECQAELELEAHHHQANVIDFPGGAS